MKTRKTEMIDEVKSQTAANTGPFKIITIVVSALIVSCHYLSFTQEK